MVGTSSKRALTLTDRESLLLQFTQSGNTCRRKIIDKSRRVSKIYPVISFQEMLENQVHWHQFFTRLSSLNHCNKTDGGVTGISMLRCGIIDHFSSSRWGERRTKMNLRYFQLVYVNFPFFHSIKFYINLDRR